MMRLMDKLTRLERHGAWLRSYAGEIDKELNGSWMLYSQGAECKVQVSWHHDCRTLDGRCAWALCLALASRRSCSQALPLQWCLVLGAPASWRRPSLECVDPKTREDLHFRHACDWVQYLTVSYGSVLLMVQP